jgi:hypothetical protein
MKILILGGYGVFGGRLAELLTDLPELTILIAGRSQEKAEAFCKTLNGQATFVPIAIDRSFIASALALEKPDILVDASGPFQAYGEDPYSVIKACLEAQVHYLDLADAADFVVGVSQFDALAKAAGVTVLSGVSSFPVLTSAVVKELSRDIVPLSIRGGIAPSPYAGVGMNVMRAVVGYAGGPVKLTRDGKQTVAKGLAESMRYSIAPPGMLPLNSIHFSLVDVPDLQLLPLANPSVQDIWMGAGALPESLHRILNLLAKMRSWFRLPSLEPLAPLCYSVLNLLKFGEHRGGMFVELKGELRGELVTRSWHLLAEGDDGPYIPSMAIETIVRKWLTGSRPEAGARPATDTLDLADYDIAFNNRSIFHGMRSSDDMKGTLYQAALCSTFADLPDKVQQLHSAECPSQWQGKAQVIRGKGALASLVAWLNGFPKATDSIDITVSFTPTDKGESWQRNFGGKTFSSFQALGTGRYAGLVTERFGPVTVGLATVVKDKRLYLIPRRWSFLGLPIPKILLPGGDSFEEEVDGKFRFDVRIELPVVGLVVAYKGCLEKS